MSETSEDDRVSVYDDEIANGDPVIAYVNDGRGEATTLGTGFESMGHLLGDIEHAMKTGNSTTHLPSDSAALMEGAESVDVFTLGAHIEHPNPETIETDQ